MDHLEAGRYWNNNAEAWTALARAGFDISRDYLNTPAFFKMLPGIDGLPGLDIGCGEGHNTRLLAQKGARMTAVDISEIFIEKAKEEDHELQSIRYLVASAVHLPFPDEAFHFATSFMCLMDIPEVELALAEAYRVIRPGGFFQFSITHPCFDTLNRSRQKDTTGRTQAFEEGNYFSKVDEEIEEWLFSAAPPEWTNRFSKFKIPKFQRTLSFWLNAVIDAGFLLERFDEPTPGDEVVNRQPRLKAAQKVPYFLLVRCRKS